MLRYCISGLLIALIPVSLAAFPFKLATPVFCQHERKRKVHAIVQKRRNANVLRGGGQEEADYARESDFDRNSTFGNSILTDHSNSATLILEEGSMDSQGRENVTVLEALLSTTSAKRHYNWTEFFPRIRSKGVGFWEQQMKVLKWVVTGSSAFAAKPSDSKAVRNLNSLARMLVLLREFESKFGSVLLAGDVGGPQVQRHVLESITRDLYSSGTPTWVLETIMERVAEGMTGKKGVEFMLYPRKCLMFFPSSGTGPATTNMFKINPGFDISKLGAVEQVAVRLASFASNTRSVERLNSALLSIPNRQQLQIIKKRVIMDHDVESRTHNGGSWEADELAKEILALASSTYGLFFYLNSPKFQAAARLADKAAPDKDDDFWQVKDSTRDTFTRLAANEAAESLERIRKNEKQLYPPTFVQIFRVLSAAGACGMWFGGSIPDMIVSGALAVVVAVIGSKLQSMFDERVMTEVVGSFFVGLIAGVLTMYSPNKFCFGAIAVASVMDMMQGFKVVYAVIEIMSKNVVTGTARLMEGILFTGLVSYSLKFGLDVAMNFVGAAAASTDYANMLVSANGISEKYFPLILPFAATAWSGLFRPSIADLPLMAFHGILAFCLNWAGAPLFAAAMCVTFSSGIISRFTGREALGNALAGLYALVPGTYMVRALLSPSRVNFIETVLFSAATIGLGGWTGTVLCSPTILGKSSWSFRRKEKQKHSTMLYF